MTDAEMILAYDKARKTRNDALDALSKIHKQLLTKVKKANGALKTKSGYATVSYSTNQVKDKETVARLVADGTIPTTVKRIEKLSVVATSVTEKHFLEVSPVKAKRAIRKGH